MVLKHLKNERPFPDWLLHIRQIIQFLSRVNRFTHAMCDSTAKSFHFFQSKSLHDFPRRVTGPKKYEKPSEDSDTSSEPFGDDRGASGEVGEPSASSEDIRLLSDEKPT